MSWSLRTPLIPPKAPPFRPSTTSEYHRLHLPKKRPLETSVALFLRGTKARTRRPILTLKSSSSFARRQRLRRAIATARLASD